MSKTSSSSNKLKVFISSKMAELREVREVVAHALDNKGIYAWLYESRAGARPEDVVETSLSEVEARVSKDEIARLQAEVDRLQATSRGRLPQGTAVDYLAQQTRVWFETLGYHFGSYEVRAKDYFE
jgi:hypothetical protein